MFDRFRLKIARLRDARVIHRLFLAIDSKIHRRDVTGLIRERKVFVLKRRKRIRAAFSYTILGISGIFGVMYVRKLAVAPGMRGRGIGSFILARIKKLAMRLGLIGFFLFSLAKARAFYEKNRLKSVGSLFWWLRGGK